MMLCSYFLTHPFAPPISWPDQLKFACYGPALVAVLPEIKRVYGTHMETNEYCTSYLSPYNLGHFETIVKDSCVVLGETTTF